MNDIKSWCRAMRRGPETAPKPMANPPSGSRQQDMILAWVDEMRQALGDRP